MDLREIETLDNDAMNGRVAGLVSRYWHRQGYTVEVGTKRRAGVVEPALWPTTELPRPGCDPGSAVRP